MAVVEPPRDEVTQRQGDMAGTAVALENSAEVEGSGVDAYTRNKVRGSHSTVSGWGEGIHIFQYL